MSRERIIGREQECARLNDCKKSLQLTMITTYGVKNNKYSGIVQSQVVLSDLFR